MLLYIYLKESGKLCRTSWRIEKSRSHLRLIRSNLNVEGYFLWLTHNDSARSRASWSRKWSNPVECSVASDGNGRAMPDEIPKSDAIPLQIEKVLKGKDPAVPN